MPTQHQTSSGGDAGVEGLPPSGPGLIHTLVLARAQNKYTGEEKDAEEGIEAGGVCAAKTLNMQTHVHEKKIHWPGCFYARCVAHGSHNGTLARLANEIRCPSDQLVLLECECDPVPFYICTGIYDEKQPHSRHVLKDRYVQVVFSASGWKQPGEKNLEARGREVLSSCVIDTRCLGSAEWSCSPVTDLVVRIKKKKKQKAHSVISVAAAPTIMMDGTMSTVAG